MHIMALWHKNDKANFNSTEQNTSSAVGSCSVSQEIPAFYATDSSLPCSHKPAICPFPEPDESSVHIPPLIFILLCGNKMSTRCNRGFYCESYCLLNMFRAPLCPSSGAQEYYTVVVACGISCRGFRVAGLVWS